MQEELAGIKGNTLDWVKDRLRHLRVVTVLLENNKLVYSYDGMRIMLPSTSGIYAFYSKTDWMYSEKPLYIGEANNLHQRIKYHYSESPSAKRDGTLKKTLKKVFSYSDKATRDLVVFKYIEIPFGRKEIETLLHEEYQINTKRK